MTSSQSQQGGEESFNVQAARDVNINSGMSYEDVRQIALDIFDGNLLARLDETAKRVMRERAQEIIDEVLKRIREEAPEAVGAFSDPDMRYATFTAQKEYARSGKPGLKAVLSDLLMKRAVYQQSEIVRIVLDESIEVAALLTQDHYNVLTTIFLVRHFNLGSPSLERIRWFLEQILLIGRTLNNVDDRLFRHLEYARCLIMQGPVSQYGFPFEKHLIANFGRYIQPGVEAETVERYVRSHEIPPELFAPSLLDEGHYTLTIHGTHDMERLQRHSNYSQNQLQQIQTFMLEHQLPINHVVSRLSQIAPPLDQIAQLWNNSALAVFSLTSVGISIAIANWERMANVNLPLAGWL